MLLPGGKEIRCLADGENRRTGKLVNGTLAKGFLNPHISHSTTRCGAGTRACRVETHLDTLSRP